MKEVKALGGKGSLGQSEVVAREVRKHKIYMRALAKVGPVVTEEASRQLRRVQVRFGMIQKSSFSVLGYAVDKKDVGVLKPIS